MQRNTMTLTEADAIRDIVCSALLREDRPYPGHMFHSLSALEGHSVYEIDTAIKLIVANEFLSIAQEPDSSEQLSVRTKELGGIPLHVVTTFVPDEDFNRLEDIEPGSNEFRELQCAIMPDVFESLDPPIFKDKRFASLEGLESFGEYCMSVGADDPLYWQKVYTRIGLEYTSESPRVSDPVYPTPDWLLEDDSDAKSRAKPDVGYVTLSVSAVLGILCGILVALLQSQGLAHIIGEAIACSILSWVFLIAFNEDLSFAEPRTGVTKFVVMSGVIAMLIVFYSIG